MADPVTPTAECDGRCITAADLGFSGYGDGVNPHTIATVDPECSLHGTGPDTPTEAPEAHGWTLIADRSRYTPRWQHRTQITAGTDVGRWGEIGAQDAAEADFDKVLDDAARLAGVVAERDRWREAMRVVSKVAAEMAVKAAEFEAERDEAWVERDHAHEMRDATAAERDRYAANLTRARSLASLGDTSRLIDFLLTEGPDV